MLYLILFLGVISKTKTNPSISIPFALVDNLRTRSSTNASYAIGVLALASNLSELN